MKCLRETIHSVKIYTHRWADHGVIIYIYIPLMSHAHIQKDSPGGGGAYMPKILTFWAFLVIIKLLPIPSMQRGPPSVCKRNSVSLVGRWWRHTECWPGSFVVSRGCGGHASFSKGSYSFVLFNWGGGSGPLPTPPTPLDPRMCLMQLEPLSLRLTQPMKAGVFIVPRY